MRWLQSPASCTEEMSPSPPANWGQKKQHRLDEVAYLGGFSVLSSNNQDPGRCFTRFTAPDGRSLAPRQVLPHDISEISLVYQRWLVHPVCIDCLTHYTVCTKPSPPTHTHSMQGEVMNGFHLDRQRE